MHGKEFNPDGTIKDEVRQQKISQGRNPAAVDSYAQRLKEEFDEWKRLDETDPEPWPIFTAYDFFTPTEKQQFNPDGSLKPEYRESELARGTSESWLDEMERRKKLEVDSYNKVSARDAEIGINFGEQEMNRLLATSLTYLERHKQMEIDLRNCEEPSSLPFDKDTPW
ncbi:hypothetical protein H6G49_23020 [Nostoc sp. PCC 7120 = FACHB-418]|nr:hypothetical protein [Anabaena cylindrica FACHB-318]MBD2255801.1 hypothetical protein [Nostoc parmelioides FACHB-3921]MBD2266005.1 hypothetical protein [Anabaena sp. FACHB-709]MBD2275462.1 hypothetical protein [Nostoc sp. PCC 7120 = FACHB-418]MBD2286287.1 hypothetical protein [Anabaena cylindrica FACHB-170]MBD2352216.1 hypothetical protein [Trichormus variabilis FACHB-171]